MALLAPFYYPRRLTLKRMLEIQSENNVLQRDIEIKQALGIPATVFARGYDLIRKPA